MYLAEVLCGDRNAVIRGLVILERSTGVFTFEAEQQGEKGYPDSHPIRLCLLSGETPEPREEPFFCLQRGGSFSDRQPDGVV